MRNRTRSILALALAASVAGGALAAESAPGRSERLVTKPTGSHHADPAAAFGPSGISAVVWEDSKGGVQGQVFDPSGTPRGPVLELAANRLPAIPGEGVAEINREPAVVFLPNDGFLVAWTSERGYLRTSVFHQDFEVEERRVVARRFRADGRPAGPAYPISEVADRHESWPRLHVTGGGRVLAGWRSTNGLGEEGGLFVRHLNPWGRGIGVITRVSAAEDTEAQYLSFASGPGGDVLLAWEGCCDAGGDLGVYTRAYRAADRSFGDIRQVHVVTDQKQRRPSVVADGDRGYLVVWQGIIDRTTGHIFGRFVGPEGEPAGGQFRVSHGHGPVQVAPGIAAAPGGGFLAVWRDWVGVAFGVSAQRLDAAGQPIGEPVRLSSGKTQKNGRTSLASDGAGGYLVPWEAGYRGRPAIATGRLHLD